MAFNVVLLTAVGFDSKRIRNQIKMKKEQQKKAKESKKSIKKIVYEALNFV